MGLQGNLTDSTTNVTVSDAYFRIGAFNGGKGGFQIVVECWNDEATRAFRDEIDPTIQRHPICIRNHTDFTLDLVDTDNIFIQAYNHLKSLPEYTGHIDV